MQENSDNFIVYNRQNTVTLRVYNKDFEIRIKLKLVKSLIAQNIMKNIINNKNFEIQERILIFQDRMYVLIRCKQEIINIYHESRIHNH